MSELKRCPFCGGEAEFVRDIEKVNIFDSSDFVYVRCKKCKAQTRKLYYSAVFHKEDEEYEIVKQAWNTRKPMQNIVERLEEEYHEIDKSKKESYENRDWETFDMFTNLNRGIYKAIAIVNTIVKEEGGIDERN